MYVAAFEPDVGETAGALQGRNPPAGGQSVIPAGGGFLYLNSSAFAKDFAAGVPKAMAHCMAISQVPIAADAFGAKVTVTARSKKPSFAVIPQQDRQINPDLERFMAGRAKSETLELLLRRRMRIDRGHYGDHVSAIGCSGGAARRVHGTDRRAAPRVAYSPDKLRRSSNEARSRVHESESTDYRELGVDPIDHHPAVTSCATSLHQEPLINNSAGPEKRQNFCAYDEAGNGDSRIVSVSQLVDRYFRPMARVSHS